MNIRPLHDRVVVRRLEEEKTSPGGIVIPDSATEKPIQGKSSPLVTARSWITARSVAWMSKRATRSFLVNTQARKLKLTVKNSW